MPLDDILKKFRDKDYSSDKKEDKGMDSGEKNETPRIISLTDDEKQNFAQAKPGEDLACEMHGTLEDDGHFHVMSVSPMGGGESEEDGMQKMSQMVAQRVQPTMQPSPSA
jgi:hypothetical protein